ncbi:DUF7511 domain-containing protein [Halobellus sp. GM3]|uniref:DUF7511 domain-containing protein n=1 Tax=Halobellus sp. GM3 TaxID=3458410 RepID=UPI00403E25BD
MPIDPDLPTDSPPADDGTASDTDGREQALVARVETYEGDADECTIYPAEADSPTLQTTWISAEEGSFVSLDSMR